MSSELGDRPDRDSGEPTVTDEACVFTLGYQGRSLHEVLAIVQQNGIAQVLDVRENARSRKPGFSSSDLEAALASAGIAYVHLPQLGCERESRHALWKGSTTSEFQDRYRRKLAENRESWPDLARRVRRSRSLLLCLERDPTQCHRAVLGERLRADGFQVQDL